MTIILSCLLLHMQPVLHGQPVIAVFEAPGYGTPASGVWYECGRAAEGVPLGALGTGFLEFTSAGVFGVNTLENNWLSPTPAGPRSGFLLRVGGDEFPMFSAHPPREGLRFWGHFPCADVNFGEQFRDARVHLRAFAPLAPHDYAASEMPVVFFRFTVENTGMLPREAYIRFDWDPMQDEVRRVRFFGEDPGQPEAPRHGLACRVAQGSYAIGALGEGWELQHDQDETLMWCSALKMLQPGESADVLFALAWHFPEWDSSDGERLRHRYAATYADAARVLDAALPQGRAIEAAIVRWQERIYGSRIPPMLQDALINGLYILGRNSWWMDDGRFFLSESFTGCPITETFVCRFNGSFPLALLWPECEKATMREFIRTQAESGQIAFGFGTPMGTRTPMWDLQKPIVSTEFVLTCWRNARLWNDDDYLREIYPAMQRAMRFALTLDTDGNGLVNDAPGSDSGFPANQYYDVWPWYGASAYTGSISLAALHAIEAAALRVGDATFAELMRETRERAAGAFDRLLWTGEYYRLYNDPAGMRRSDTSLTNALCGQWFAFAAGLGRIVPDEKLHATIDAVLRLNTRATDYGAVNGVRPDGSIDDSFAPHSAVITIGEVWNFCAMTAFAGRADDAVRLFEESYANIASRQRNPWNIPWSYKPDTGEISWGIHYYSNTCVWTLFQALDPDGYAALSR